MANKKLRLDMALVEQGFFPSRTRAQASIMAGGVLVNGEADTRADRTVLPEDKISLKEKSCPYVSRGGLKLAGAMKVWNISVKDKTCVDIGVATGGFSDCMIQAGAKDVYGVDVGKGQLADEMRRYKNKKQELKAVTNNMDEGLLFLNPVWEIESINKSAVKFFGKEKQELLGTSFFMLDDSDEIRQLLAKIEQEGKGRLVINRGSSYYQLNGSRITDKGFVLLIMDVTARTASEKIRREFSANVSHELKTPLQSVLGYSEIMLSGLVKPEDTKRFLQKINDEAHNLLRLIDDIMQLSKLDELTHDMMEEFTLQDVAQSALARLKDKACRLQVSLQLVDSTGGDSKLLGISSLMEEIFFNLLDNGLKYNHPGGEVTLRLSEGENKYTVSVADTGMGIPGSELPHIFERFYRVDRSRHKAIEGTGLGLSIVKHGVGFHGGSIRVVSTVGQGTEFIMKFPKPKYEAEK